MTLAAGSRLGPYEIVARLGAGGMGEVWRARDPRLDREVAIKLVREGTSDPERRRRFEHEARVIARLQHPNLLVVHDVGEHAGEPYLVTELLAGETLREIVGRGPVEVATVLGWAREIALGLAAAHAAGVVHRDLKPENVFLTVDGRVKLLDFGLAKLVGPNTAGDARTWTHLTAPGLVVGTCGYMAPEQVRGQSVDERTDLFALGAILHELLSGRGPFARGAPLESLAAILSEPAPPLPAHVPSEVARILERCLAKEPARRYASAAEVLGALDAAQGGSAAVATRATAESARSVAVLPFRDLAGTGEDEALGLGIADTVVTELAAARLLVVRPTSATLRFRGRVVEPEVAGRELGVDAVLDGRFQRAGDRLRITVQLVDTASAQPLWATKLDGSMADPFRLQDEIAQRVVRALAGEPAELAAVERVAPEAGAYELYLRGRGHLARESLAEANLAVDALETAVRADPRFGLAWATLADAYLTIHVEFDPEEDWYRRAERACERALELDSALPEGRYMRGRLAWSARGGWDHALALRECAAAVAARPGLHEAWHRLGTVLLHVSLLEESSACFARAHAINPQDFSSYAIWGFCRLMQLRLDEALAISDGVWGESPSAWVAYQRIQCRIHLGRIDESERLVDAGCRQFPASPLLVSLRALLAALRGDAAQARRQIELVERNRRALNHYHHAQYEVATSLAHLGESDAALAQLAEAAHNGFPCFDYFARDPLLGPLRGESRFTALLAEMDAERGRYRELWRELAIAV
ncbi:MAG TPA: protein kinase [Thermoanaerobaculia bacterium]|jgi:TolB-like protein